MIILIIILAIIALPFILALFSKKGYSIYREVTVNRPIEQVFAYVCQLKNQKYFNKWVMADPNLRQEFVGTDGTVGFINKWEGNKQAGKGEQEITGIVPGERMDMEIRFIKPIPAISAAAFTTNTVNGNQTRIKWDISSQMNYPYNLCSSSSTWIRCWARIWRPALAI